MGFQKSAHLWCAAVSRGPFVLVGQATQNWSTFDVFMAEVGGGVGRLGWAKVAGAVGSSAVVVVNVLREDYTQVPLTEDQHAVGELGSESAYEPFGETVRPRATRRNPDYLDAHIGENGIERCGELAGPVPDEEREFGDAIAEVHHEAADLLCGPWTVWVCGRAQQVHGSAGDLQHEEHVDPSERHRAVHVKEVAGLHRRRLRAQELPPGRVGVPDRCRRYPQPLENAADRGGPHAVAEFEQLALDSLISPALVLSGQTLD